MRAFQRHACPQETKAMTARSPDIELQDGGKRAPKTKRSSPLFERTVAQFQRALRRVVPFSAADPDGDHKSRTWQMLSHSAGVSRAALGKYMEADAPPNPVLESVCRLAEELSIPPAFLLMTADDWTRLFTAFHTYQSSLHGRSQFHDYVEKTVASPEYACKPVDIIRDAQAIAGMTDVGRSAVRQAASVIANVSLAMPLRDLPPEARGLALVVASVVATSSPKSRFLSEQEAHLGANQERSASQRTDTRGSDV